MAEGRRGAGAENSAELTVDGSRYLNRTCFWGTRDPGRARQESEAVMESYTQHRRGALHHLYMILDAGEQGYRDAAANVSNRALKMLFWT